MRLNNILLPYLIRKAAKAHGFLDPINVLSQLSRFGQPSQVLVPTELLRSGALFHARGLINSQAIQHNLDWIWPYWVERQFDPRDRSFIPRAFQLTHINLTHRNWTAVGLPDSTVTPIVDPRGLVTPLWDSWSVDCWVIDQDGGALYPSRLDDVRQTFGYRTNLSVTTEARGGGKELISRVEVKKESDRPVCQIAVTALSRKAAWLVVSLRPANPEGVSFIHQIGRLDRREGWRVNKSREVLLSGKPDGYQLSAYRQGDVKDRLFQPESGILVKCPVGMATAAALFELKPRAARGVTVRIPLEEEPGAAQMSPGGEETDDTWSGTLQKACRVNIPDERYRQLYDGALRTLVLHTAGEALAGPYTYKRFWFRDAVFIVQALLCAGFARRAREVIERFPRHQTASGYFSSQEGEWDSNGQVLWVLKRYVETTNRGLGLEWKDVVVRAARWIMRKRLPSRGGEAHAGLLPSGFSAEHLGPNDYYYWDDFWGVAGLRAAAYLMRRYQDEASAGKFEEEADSLLACVEKSLQSRRQEDNQTGMPASPYRRMDSGAIGSLAAGYPLQLWDGRDQRLLKTADYLMDNCLVKGGFFHDMSHSGINPYLTLHIAQVLMRAGDTRFYDLMNTIATLASPTGQWPEAIHPATQGGCMGDGQHVWAAAEWTLMLRNCFVREDKESACLILCSGVLPLWYANQRRISFGPAPTAFGPVEVTVTDNGGDLIVEWAGEWHGAEPSVEIRMPGFDCVRVPSGAPHRAVISPQGAER